VAGDTRGLGRLPIDERTVPVTRNSSFLGPVGRPDDSNQSVGWSRRDESDLPNRRSISVSSERRRALTSAAFLITVRRPKPHLNDLYPG
jgi:hypothetical protein